MLCITYLQIADAFQYVVDLFQYVDDLHMRNIVITILIL